MREVYRKFGRVVRRENAFLIRIDEAGEAIDEDALFSAVPIGTPIDLPAVDPTDVNTAAAAIEAVVAPPVAIERLIVSEGIAIHQANGTEWSEQARRVHLSMTHGGVRALVDLAEFSTGVIERVARALARVSSDRPRPQRLRLAENVGAALLPSVTALIEVNQWPAAHDGKGGWIESRRVTSDLPPNWFRPSYRTRPLRAWFHLRAEAHGQIDRTVPEAVALLAPIHRRTLHLLCVDGEDAFITHVSAESIGAVNPSPTWYPYAAGCFGAEMML